MKVILGESLRSHHSCEKQMIDQSLFMEIIREDEIVYYPILHKLVI